MIDACFGIGCEKHHDCQHYANVDNPDAQATFKAMCEPVAARAIRFYAKPSKPLGYLDESECEAMTKGPA